MIGKQIKKCLVALSILMVDFCISEQVITEQYDLAIKQEGEVVYFCFHRPDIAMDIRRIMVFQTDIKPWKEVWHIDFPGYTLEANCVAYGSDFVTSTVVTKPVKLQKGKRYKARIITLNPDIQGLPQGEFIKE